jgi:hypothetical protein
MEKIILKKISEGYEFKGMEYVQKGVQNFVSNIGLYLFLSIVGSALTLAMSSIPGINMLTGLILTPLLAGGFLIVAEKRFRNEPASIKDFFSATNHFGGLFLSTFLQILVILGISIALMFILISPIAVILKQYDFSNGITASGALPIIFVSVFLLLFTLLACYTWYTFTYNYVIFGKYDGSEAMGISRRIVMKQYTVIVLFVFLLTAITFIYSMLIAYATGELENIKLLMEKVAEAIRNQDQDALKNLKFEPGNLVTQIVGMLATSILSPLYYCIIQAAFRDINTLDGEEIKDNTIFANQIFEKDEFS